MSKYYTLFSFPTILFYLLGAVGAWGARRLVEDLTTAGCMVAAVELGGFWVTHQEGQLSETTLRIQKNSMQ